MFSDYHGYQYLREQLTAGDTTCAAQVSYFLDRIESRKNLNAFAEVFAEEALERARSIDQKITAGKAGRLAGMVIGIKDLICYKEHLVGASSGILQGFTSQITATALQRLLEEDVIVIGRQNCDEFGMGSANLHSHYGPVLHPDDETKVPGGSSGGSAVAVAAGLCHASLGSDTGGSVRLPAAFCGVFGLKPGYGRISRYGLIAYASSFDQIGPLTSQVGDAELLFSIMAGADERDATSSRFSDPTKEGSTDEETRAIYFRQALEAPELDPEIRQNFLGQLKRLKAAGWEIEAVDFPLFTHLVPCYYVLTTAEAASNLARYDGVRYGQGGQARGISQQYASIRDEGFGEEVKRRILLGNFVLSAGHTEAYFHQAQKVRGLIAQHTRQLFDKSDLILSPTAPGTAFDRAAKPNPVEMYLTDQFTVHASLCGIPALSIPITRHSNGLPLGVQLTAPWGKESNLFGYARKIETILGSNG